MIFSFANWLILLYRFLGFFLFAWNFWNLGDFGCRYTVSSREDYIFLDSLYLANMRSLRDDDDDSILHHLHPSCFLDTLLSRCFEEWRKVSFRNPDECWQTDSKSLPVSRRCRDYVKALSDPLNILTVCKGYDTVQIAYNTNCLSWSTILCKRIGQQGADCPVCKRNRTGHGSFNEFATSATAEGVVASWFYNTHSYM